MALNITTGKKKRAQKVVIYGAEGIGKTTLASQFPDPLFIDTEGGTSHLDVARIEGIKNWTELINTIKEVATTQGVCRTLVIDTADWAEQLEVAHVCAKWKKAGIEDFGFGKGYTYLQEEFAPFLRACDRVIDAGINVVITAHAQLRKIEQPDEMGAYDHWELKCSKKVAQLLKEWADLLLFCNYKTDVITSDSGSKKAMGGKRVIYTSHSPVWDAKNRHGLPECIDMDYESIRAAIGDVLTPLEELEKRIMDSGIDASALFGITATKYPDITSLDEYPTEFIAGWILPNWQKILTNINK